MPTSNLMSNRTWKHNSLHLLSLWITLCFMSGLCINLNHQNQLPGIQYQSKRVMYHPSKSCNVFPWLFLDHNSPLPSPFTYFTSNCILLVPVLTPNRYLGSNASSKSSPMSLSHPDWCQLMLIWMVLGVVALMPHNHSNSMFFKAASNILSFTVQL